MAKAKSPKAEPGFVYAMTNPSYKEGLFKIGFTTIDPEHRAKTLFRSGSPTPFTVYRSIKVSDVRLFERNIHTILKQFRVSDNREWFAATEEIIDLIFSLAEQIMEFKGVPDCNASEKGSSDGSGRSKAADPVRRLLDRIDNAIFQSQGPKYDDILFEGEKRIIGSVIHAMFELKIVPKDRLIDPFRFAQALKSLGGLDLSKFGGTQVSDTEISRDDILHFVLDFSGSYISESNHEYAFLRNRVYLGVEQDKNDEFVVSLHPEVNPFARFQEHPAVSP